MDTSRVDRISFFLGMINCFAEMVACGVKHLAISPPLTPEEYEKVAPYSKKMVEEFGISEHLETSLMITDLQSPEFTRNKYSILYYKDSGALQEYFDLKSEKEQMEKEGVYDLDERHGLSIAFMRLLSYPDEVIKERISGKAKDPFMLIE